MKDSTSLYLPRILCLHGGGVNARVFRMQCRAIIARLGGQFRFVFVDAPFECQPHDDIIAVYKEYAPFYRWLRFKDEHSEVDAKEVSKQILFQLQTAMEQDEGTGAWVGVLGFSQGGKIAASLLWAQDQIIDADKQPLPGVRFHFGIIMAGSAPIVLLDASGEVERPCFVSSAADMSHSSFDWPESAESDGGRHTLWTPTLHVHGLQDGGVWRHKILLESYCHHEIAQLVEWDGGHRLPIKSKDIELLAGKILKMAEETGVI